MSNFHFWSFQPYYKQFEDRILLRYLNNRSHRLYKFYNMHLTTPGWIGDPNPAFKLYDRWKNRSKKAKKLYWRYH